MFFLYEAWVYLCGIVSSEYLVLEFWKPAFNSPWYKINRAKKITWPIFCAETTLVCLSGVFWWTRSDCSLFFGFSMCLCFGFGQCWVMICDLVPVFVRDRSTNQVINTMSSAVCTKNRRSVPMNKNTCPLYEITIFESLQTQKEMKLGPAKINMVPVWLGITHEGEKDKYFLQKINCHTCWMVLCLAVL
jgi:hypothetical protein